MSDIDKVLKIKGTLFAGAFTPEGKCTEYKGKKKMAAETAETMAKYASTVNRLFGFLGESFTKLTKVNMLPYHGFAHCGGDHTVFVGADKWVIVDETADWNEVSWAILAGKYPEE